MLALERQLAIIEYLKEKKCATVNELADQFFIGPASIRRDLDKLEKQKLVRRTYGGVVLVDGLVEEIPIHVRERDYSEAKNTIGQIAASYISVNDVITLDSSTSVYSMIPHLHSKVPLTVLTNGLKTSITLGEQLHTKVYCCGGRLRENSLSLVGSQAEQFFEHFGVGKMFFSCRALSYDFGPMDSSEEEAELRKKMIRMADEVCLLCDSSKFDKKSFYRIAPLDDIDMIITEKKPSEEWIAMLKNHNVKLVCSLSDLF